MPLESSLAELSRRSRRAPASASSRRAPSGRAPADRGSATARPPARGRDHRAEHPLWPDVARDVVRRGRAARDAGSRRHAAAAHSDRADHWMGRARHQAWADLRRGNGPAASNVVGSGSARSRDDEDDDGSEQISGIARRVFKPVRPTVARLERPGTAATGSIARGLNWLHRWGGDTTPQIRIPI